MYHLSENAGAKGSGQPADTQRTDLIEFKRARQRGYQAKYRQRLKREIEDLTKRSEATAQQLASAKNAVCSLQNHNSQLQSRIRASEASLAAFTLVRAATGAADAQVEALPEETQPAVPKQSAVQSGCCFYDSVPNARATVLDAEEESSSSSLDAADASEQLMGNSSFGPSPIWRPEAVDRMQSNSPTTIRALISYPLLSAYAPKEAQANAAQNSCDSLGWFKSTLVSYMHDTAVRLQCSAQDIHWLFQGPYQARVGECVTAGQVGDANNFSGWLSLVLGHTACILESLILEAEHEFLEVSTGLVSTVGSSSLLQQLQKEASTPIDPVDTGAPLNQALLQCLHVCTGIDSTCSIAVGMKRIVCMVLHRSTSVLPFGVWRAACMRIVKWIQELIEALQKRMPDAEAVIAAHLPAQQKGMGSEGVPELPHTAVSAAHLLMNRAMLCEMEAVINEAPLQEERMQGTGLVDVRCRMMELEGYLVLARLCTYSNSPRATLQLLAKMNGQGKQINIASERMTVKIIRSLHLSDDQSQKLAQCWHVWCRRRRALDSKLVAVASSFQDLLPDTEDLHLGLLSANMHVTEAADLTNTLVDTTPGNFYACMEPRNTPLVSAAKAKPQSMQHDTNMQVVSKLAIDTDAGSECDDRLEEYEQSEEMQAPLYMRLPKIMHNVYGPEVPEAQSCCRGEVHACEVTECVVSGSDLDLDTTNESSCGTHCNDITNAFHAWLPMLAEPSRPGSQDKRAKNVLLLQLVKQASAVHNQADGATEPLKHSTAACTAPQRLHPSTTESHNTNILTVQCASDICTCVAQRATAHTAQHRVAAAEPTAAAQLFVQSISQLAGRECTAEATGVSAQRTQKRLLGESGDDMLAVERAMAELLSYSYSDFLLIKHSTVLGFGLTPVQHTRKNSAHLQGAPNFDYLRLQQVAAHDERWKELFAPMRIFDGPITLTHGQQQ